jgi:hypothetical protein
MSNSLPKASDSPSPCRSGRGRCCVFIGTALVALVALFYTVENWRGKRAWEKYKVELQAQGESLDWKDYIPPRVPDEQNFIKTPFLEAVGYKGKVNTNAWAPFDRLNVGGLLSAIETDGSSWEQGAMSNLKAGQAFVRSNAHYMLPPLPQEPAADIVAVFRPVERELSEIRQASQRPYAQFIIEGNDPLSVTIPNFVGVRTLVQSFALLASAELALHQVDAAFQDTKVMLRFAAALKNHPTLVASMISVAITGVSVQAFWEGWASGQWSDAQLEQFQKIFAAIDLTADVDRSMRVGERGGINYIAENYSGKRLAELFSWPGKSGFKDWLFDWAVRCVPRGWIYQNRLAYNRAMQDMILANYDPQKRLVTPKKLQMEAFERFVEGYSPFRYLAAIAIPNFTKAMQTAARNQTAVSEAALACALERHRRALGQYPETLPALVPRFIDRLPHDLIGGQPLRYRRTDDGKFLLYSIGWNEKDDGGALASDRQSGDWVWPFPVKP